MRAKPRPAGAAVLLAVIACALAPAAASAAPGQQLWVAHHAGPRHGDEASAVAVSPDGERTYVSGYSLESTNGDGDELWAIETVAYDSDTGTKLWTARHA